jgi:PIN domain nuclease of toxin-antitoxin system
MVYLIDTQILIWFQLNDSQLKPAIYNIIIDVNNTIIVSDVSLYEIAIKQKIKKLPDLLASLEDIITVANEDGFSFLAISHSHLKYYENVPLLAEHKDPFDRLLIAVALAENITLISSDEKFVQYIPQLKLIKA